MYDSLSMCNHSHVFVAGRGKAAYRTAALAALRVALAARDDDHFATVGPLLLQQAEAQVGVVRMQLLFIQKWLPTHFCWDHITMTTSVWL